MNVDGKVALVTGGSRGIGRAISLALAEKGATVIVNYLRKQAAADELEAVMKAKGYTFRFIKGNIGEEEEIHRMCDEISTEFGKLDIFVSNAVFGVVKPVQEIQRKHWERTININAGVLLSFVQRMVTMPKFDGGNIVAISSLGGRRVIKDYSIIGASKAALESMIRYIAVEYASKGLRANAVSPGIVETDSIGYFAEGEAMVREAVENTPLGKLVTPEDVAKLVTFLCSDESSMITGEVINIDGGNSLKG